MKSYKLLDIINKRKNNNPLQLRIQHFKIPHENGNIRYVIYNNGMISYDFLFKSSSDLPFGDIIIIEGERIEHN